MNKLYRYRLTSNFVLNKFKTFKSKNGTETLNLIKSTTMPNVLTEINIHLVMNMVKIDYMCVLDINNTFWSSMPPDKVLKLKFNDLIIVFLNQIINKELVKKKENNKIFYDINKINEWGKNMPNYCFSIYSYDGETMIYEFMR